jgi:RimJ/RimL family protein N-acetyltransferase
MVTGRALDPDGIELREMVEADIPGFRNCLGAVAGERRFLVLLEAPPLERMREWYLDSLEHGSVRVVALDGSNLIGWCDIRRNDYPTLDHAGELGMGMLKPYRGKGIGLALIREAVRLAQERGLEKVELEVFATNTPAIRLYEKEGFEVEGRKRRARKLDREYEDIILMALFLQLSPYE